MDFSIELREFPSAVHHRIYDAARKITPPDISLAGMRDASLRASCLQLHGLFMDMLSDMYESPAAYGLPVGALEAHLGGRKVNGVKRKQPSKTKRILSETYNAVSGYQVLLCLLGKLGRPEGGRLILAPDDLEAIAKKVNSSNSPIPLDTRMEGLGRVGLTLREGVLTADGHPGALDGLRALATSFDKMNSFGYFAFQNLEFRNIEKPYKPTYEDYVRPLSAERRAMADALNAAALSMGLKPYCNTFWKIDYKHRSTQVLCLENADGALAARIPETYGWDDMRLIERRLAAEDGAFQSYILKHLWGCTGCSTSHLGGFVTLLGKRRRVCLSGGIGFRWRDPAPEDMPAIEKCLAFRRDIIDEQKAAG